MSKHKRKIKGKRGSYQEAKSIQRKKLNKAKEEHLEVDPDTEPDWEGEYMVCGASPIVPITGMCGPCTFGEAETIGGNW